MNKKQASVIVTEGGSSRLENYLSNGWTVVSTTPFHIAGAGGGDSSFKDFKTAPILVIVQSP